MSFSHKTYRVVSNIKYNVTSIFLVSLKRNTYHNLFFGFFFSPHLPTSLDPKVVFAGGNRFVQLIDFGQSIDMSKYPPRTTFLTKVDTKCFQCIEMMTNRPWTYQVKILRQYSIICNQRFETSFKYKQFLCACCMKI